MSLSVTASFTYRGNTQTIYFTEKGTAISGEIRNEATSQCIALFENISNTTKEQIIWRLKNGYSILDIKTNRIFFVSGLLGGGKPSLIDTIRTPQDLAKALRETDASNEEYNQLLDLAYKVIEVYRSHSIKTPSLIQELMFLAQVGEERISREILKSVYYELDSAPLLDVDLLVALRSILQGTHPWHLDPDDLVNVLKTLRTKHESFHIQKTTFSKLYDLLQVLSGILDVMGDANVEKLSYDNLHDPLYRNLQELTEHEDWRILAQSAYAKESLLRIGHDKTKLMIFLSKALNVALGVSNIGQVITNKDPSLLLDAYENFKQALYNQGKRQSWYEEIRLLKILIESNQFAAFLNHVKSLDPSKIPPKEHVFLLSNIFLLLIDNIVNFSECSMRYSALKALDELYKCNEWNLRKKSKHLEKKIKEGICAQLELLANDKESSIAFLAKNILRSFDQTSRTTSFVITKKNPVPPSNLLLEEAKLTPKTVSTLIRELQSYYLNDSKTETLLSTYISSQGSYSHSFANSFPLQDEIMKFLKGSKKVMLIQGGSGAGKTAFGQYLTYHLWKTKKKGDPICLFIPPIIYASSKRAVEETLESHGFSQSQIQQVKKEERFLFIFDGYDEIGKRINLYHLNRLEEWNAQAIITCRTQYLHGNYDSLFAPLESNGAKINDLTELWITPFTDREIDAYLQQYLKQAEGPVWKDWRQYRKHINSITGLRELISVPFLLYVTAEVLPEIVIRHEEEHSDKVLKLLKVDLYNAFIAKWFHRSEVRLRRAGELSDFEGDIKRSFLAYCKKLAEKMHEEEIAIVTYTPPAWGEEDSLWEGFFGKSDPIVPLLRDGAPLQKVGKNSYSFVHQSILEYFIYRAGLDNLKQHDKKQKQKQKVSIGSFI